MILLHIYLFIPTASSWQNVLHFDINLMLKTCCPFLSYLQFAICFHVCMIYLLLCFLTEHLFIIFSNNLLISISRQNDRTHSLTNFHNLSLQKISPHQSILQQKVFHLRMGPQNKYYGSCGLETGQWGCTLILTDIIAKKSSNSKINNLCVYSIQQSA